MNLNKAKELRSKWHHEQEKHPDWGDLCCLEEAITHITWTSLPSAQLVIRSVFRDILKDEYGEGEAEEIKVWLCSCCKP